MYEQDLIYCVRYLDSIEILKHLSIVHVVDSTFSSGKNNHTENKLQNNYLNIF